MTKAGKNCSNHGRYEGYCKRHIPSCETEHKSEDLTSSGYNVLFFTGENETQAKIYGNVIRHFHSEKIKFGHLLENFIYEEVVENSSFKVYKNKIFEDIPTLENPCIIHKCSFSKENYEANNQECKNKKKVDIDFLVLNGKNIFVIEAKSGCDFDTKKSKGEIQSLVATKEVCKSLIDIEEVYTHVTCYDAENSSDIKLKTDHEGVQMSTYQEIASIMSVEDPVESKKRIDIKFQNDIAQKNVDFMKEFILDCMKEFIQNNVDCIKKFIQNNVDCIKKFIRNNSELRDACC